MLAIQCKDCHVLNRTLCWRNTYIHPWQLMLEYRPRPPTVISVSLRHLLTLCWSVGNGLRVTVSIVWAGFNTNKSLQYYLCIPHNSMGAWGFCKNPLSVLHSAQCLSLRTGTLCKHHYQAPFPPSVVGNGCIGLTQNKCLRRWLFFAKTPGIHAQ